MRKLLDSSSLIIGVGVGNGMAESQGLFKVLVHHMNLDLGEVLDRYVLRIIFAYFWRCLQSKIGGRFVDGCSSILGKIMRKFDEWPFSSWILMETRIWNHECIHARPIFY